MCRGLRNSVILFLNQCGYYVVANDYDVSYECPQCCVYKYSVPFLRVVLLLTILHLNSIDTIFPVKPLMKETVFLKHVGLRKLYFSLHFYINIVSTFMCNVYMFSNKY